MGEFFESEIIQEELSEINRMQEKIYGSLLAFGSMTRDQKIEHIDMLTSLLDKQKIMYTRLSLSDDPKAIEMKENLRKSVVMMGFHQKLICNFYSIVCTLQLNLSGTMLTPECIFVILSK